MTIPPHLTIYTQCQRLTSHYLARTKQLSPPLMARYVHRLQITTITTDKSIENTVTPIILWDKQWLTCSHAAAWWFSLIPHLKAAHSDTRQRCWDGWVMCCVTASEGRRRRVAIMVYTSEGAALKLRRNTGHRRERGRRKNILVNREDKKSSRKLKLENYMLIRC